MQYPDYDPTLVNQPLTDEELQSFDDLLRALSGEQAMNVEAVDGYLTALLVGPPVLGRLRTGDWLPLVWGGDGPGGAPFASNRQRKRATVLVLRHLHAIACQLQASPDDWEPVFSVAEAEGREFADAEDWCIGFLQAVALDPEAWGPLFDDPVLGPALAPIGRLGGEDAPDEVPLDDADERDALSRAVIDAVLLLHRRAQRPSA